jgi:hypothetical protein
VWCLGDSRGSGLSGQYTGWASFLPCKNYAVWGTGFTISSVQGLAVPDRYAELVKARGRPATVYVSAGFNDAKYGHNAIGAAKTFHDSLATQRVVQVWATSPDSATDKATNARLELLNASETWARNCAGADPDPNTVDGLHLTNAASKPFATCIAGKTLTKHHP